MEPTKKTNSFLEVIILEPGADAIHEAMGITEERKEELSTFIHDDVLGGLRNDQKTTITEDLHKISVNSKHANELVWMVLQYGSNLGYNRAMNEQGSNSGSGDSVHDFLRFLLEKGKRLKDFDEESDDNSDSE
jgi:hypothetical protein